MLNYNFTCLLNIFCYDFFVCVVIRSNLCDINVLTFVREM
jgi:hypothetical protein